MSDHQNLRDFLFDCMDYRHYVGSGNEATVYNLDGSEFQDIVMRVRSDGSAVEFECIEDHLLGSTFLTPVDYGYQGTCLAPSFLQGEGISFHIRQPGTSLGAFFQQKRDELHSESSAQNLIRNMLAELPVKAYGQMLKDLNFLTEIKCGIDTQGDNLMLSPTTLRWVDIERTYHRNHLEGVRAMLTSSANGGTGRLDSTTEDKLQIAAAQTNTPLDEDALRKKVATLPITRVSEKRPVSLLDLGCLPLDATPRDLKCKLDQVRQHLGFVPCPT